MDEKTLDALLVAQAAQDVATRKAVGVLFAALFDHLAAKGISTPDELKAVLRALPAGRAPDEPGSDRASSRSLPPIPGEDAQERYGRMALDHIVMAMKAELGIPD